MIGKSAILDRAAAPFQSFSKIHNLLAKKRVVILRTMVASAVFITDLQGKNIISRNYRGDYPIAKAVETFGKYLSDVDEEARKPIFHVDTNGDFLAGDDVGQAGPGGQTFAYVAVSTNLT